MKTLLLPKEVAPMLKISLAQLCRLTKAGKIPAKDVGFGKNHCWRYDEERLDKWLSEEPRKEGPPKRRNRSSTPVKHSNQLEEKVSTIQHVNGKEHGTEDPAHTL
ncbi:MAG TPA: helix-turn-helix domain-containing protein [Candidatus Binatia bacterium]|jgi:predicted site-specific integrase-resolvase